MWTIVVRHSVYERKLPGSLSFNQKSNFEKPDLFDRFDYAWLVKRNRIDKDIGNVAFSVVSVL